jgi:hypothetical protein
MERCPPKAEVARSNRVGSANPSNMLGYQAIRHNRVNFRSYGGF